jgi:hypothetical protein
VIPVDPHPGRNTGVTPDDAGPARHWDTPRTVRLIAALLGTAVIVTYLVIALRRMTYPFPLEWLEGNSLVEVQRILDGQPLYTAPAIRYVPDGYPPLYFAISAGVAKVLGVSYTSLRVVSLLSSLACFALVARLVQRDTGSGTAGIAAAGLLAATYFATDTWFDVGRVDSLFLALSAAALYAARWMYCARGAVATGLLLAAVFLTKQNGLAEGILVLAALAFGPRRRLAMLAALTYAGVVAISTIVLGLASHGWYVYYVIELMSEHALSAGALGQFWTVYLIPALGIACCAVILGARPVSPVVAAGCAALIIEAYAAAVHSGGGVNDLLPAYLAVVLLAGLAMGRQDHALLAESLDQLVISRSPNWRPGRPGRWLAVVTAALVIIQMAVLVAAFQPGPAIPGTAGRAVGQRLTTGLRQIGGTVAIPSDPGLSLLAGLPPVAHQDAVNDVLRSSDQAAITDFTRSAARAFAARLFSAVVTDRLEPPPGYLPALARYYHRCPQPLLPGVPRAVFEPVAGLRARPAYLWLPGRHQSCAATIRALDGPSP